MSDLRPDPDSLLRRLRVEEAASGRGRLKVFFGACPGVGKTYAMLLEAKARMAGGDDVVAGLVETHGRAETGALLDGIEVLPRREMEHRGVALREFDIDAALARRPALLLIDELAHDNAPGSRHVKRWQDVQEIMEAGIDVYTTVNVQHIESLNDVVSKITLVRVRETVPDSILEAADEIILVDLPPEDLLKRLADGKVYLPAQAQQAARQFFQKPNLIALRELSLRFMASRVNVQVQFARRDETIDAIWPTSERLLVCVGPSPSSAQLIRATRRLATMLHAPWVALTIEDPSTAALGGLARDMLLQNQRLAERLGAEVISLVSNRLASGVISYARARNVTKIIVGKPVQAWWRERLQNTVVDQIVRLSGDIDVYVIRGEDKLRGEVIQRVFVSQSDWFDYARALFIVFLTTIVCFILWKSLFTLPNLIMAYLAGIMITAMSGKRGPAILASFLSVVLFGYVFVPPHFTFAVHDLTYLPTFIVMFGTGVLISTLTLRLRRQIEVADQAVMRLDVQRQLAQLLSGMRGDHALHAVTRLLAETAQASVFLMLPDADGHLQLTAAWPEGTVIGDKGMSVAQWTFEHGQPAGQGTDTLTSAEALFLPLRGKQSTRGALGFVRGSVVAPDMLHQLETLASQLALALDVDRLQDEQRRARLDMESERLRNSILSSVSHDLRTPLATIMGSAGSLLQAGETMSPETRCALAQDIHTEADRLGRLIANLLEMTRLEGGGLELRRELHPVEEIVGSALRTLKKILGEREVKTDIPHDLPPVSVDGVLIEQVIINLLENALKYTPIDQPIQIRAHADGEWIVVEVADHGSGVAIGSEEKIFEKFHRGPSGAPGAGLGLAICRGLVEAHGGRISATNREGGGLSVRFTLPASPSTPDPQVSAAHPLTHTYDGSSSGVVHVAELTP